MADGLFADQGLEVEILDPAPGPANTIRVSEGGAEACLTSMAHYVAAFTALGHLEARFAAVVTRRSPMAAIVVRESPARSLGDLAGRRVGGERGSGLLGEYLAAFARLGLEAPEVIATGYQEGRGALRRGEVEALADFVDLVPQIRRTAGEVRAIPLGTEVYASGLVVADHVPTDVVSRLVSGVVAALEGQRRDPEGGLPALLARYPSANPEEALEGWRLVEPYIFDGDPVGSMDPEALEVSMCHTASVQRSMPPPVGSAYRRDLSAAGMGSKLATTE